MNTLTFPGTHSRLFRPIPPARLHNTRLATRGDIQLNVPLGDSIIRGLVAIFLPYLFIATVARCS